MTVLPSSGTGSTQTFRFNYGSASAMRYVQFGISASPLTVANSCAFIFDVGNQKLWLYNNEGKNRLRVDGGGSNSQCSVAQVQAAKAASSAGLDIAVSLTFPASFAGTKVVWMTITPWSGTAVKQPNAGTWVVSGATPAPVVSVAIGPASVVLPPGASQQFTAAVTGTTNTAVTWAASAGTVSSAGLYTAPASVTAPQTATLTATSAADATKKATATVTVQPPVAVRVTPGTATLSAGQTQQFTASVTGTTNTGVTWTASAGMVSATGLYTAPATISAQTVATVTATSVADGTKKAGATVTLKPPVSVSVTPGTATLKAGQTQQFTAAVAGTTNSGVTWTASAGTVSATGLYTTPASVTAQQTVTVTATSVADATKKATASVTVMPASVVSVTVTPATVTLAQSQTQPITATVTGTTNQALTWSMSPAIGTLSTSGTTAVYTAPDDLIANVTVEVTATSVADGSKFAKAVLSLVPVVLVSVSPTSVTLAPGQTQQFMATVSGTSNSLVQWTVETPDGSVSPSGLYTAPASLSTGKTVRVKATGVADPTRPATATVTLQPDPSSEQGPRVTFDCTDVRLTALNYGDQSYYLPNDFLVERVTFRSPTGTFSTEEWLNTGKALRTTGTSPAYYEHVYRKDQPRQFTVKVVWTTPDSRTIRADAYVTNNDPTEEITDIRLTPLFFQLPAPPIDSLNRINVAVGTDDLNKGPVDYLSGTWGSVALWHDSDHPYAQSTAVFNSPEQTGFRVALESTIVRRYEKTNTYAYSLPIPPGVTKRFSLSIRFGVRNEPVTALAPEAFLQYRDRNPNLVNWTNRNPIATWFIASGAHRTIANPRGYLSLKDLDATNVNTFHTALLAAARQTVATLDAMSVKPQGIIIWDLEGQEFDHTFTYVGAPDRLAALAPEMDAVADDLFATIRNAGYRVGVTLRPHSFGTGSVLPDTCRNDSIYDLTDKFIRTDIAFPYRSFVCVAPNTWKQNTTGTGPGGQTSTDDDEEIFERLRSRVQYARSRWGATLFYVDSNVYMDGRPVIPSIFRKLASAFPDCLFIPEWDTSLYFGATAPFKYGIQEGFETTPQARTVYPTAFSAIYLGDANPADTVVEQRLVNAVRQGDILMFRGWFRSGEVPLVERVYQKAAAIP